MTTPPNRGHVKWRAGTHNEWLQAICHMYPDALGRTYCVPPVHFNRVRYLSTTVASQPVLVLRPLPHSSPDKSKESGQPSTDNSINVHPNTKVLRHVDVQCLPVRVGRGVSQHQQQRFPDHVPLSRTHLRPESVIQGQQLYMTLQPHSHLPFFRPLWTPPPMDEGYPKEVKGSDLRDDFAQQHVLMNLQALGNQLHEVMFILSQLRFCDYLGRASFAAAADHLHRPRDLGLKYRSGEFDILLIHRHYGILVGEVKSVGCLQSQFHQSQDDRDKDVSKRVRQSIRQLDRSAYVVRHLVRDMVHGLNLMVRKTLFLPYVTKEQLLRVLQNDLQLNKEVCQGLEAGDTRQAVDLCVCSDLLSDARSYWDVTSHSLTKLRAWWRARMCSTNSQLDDNLYLDLLSRFVGPASSKMVYCVFSPPREVKTDWQAVSELGGRLVTLVLTQQQIMLLDTAPDKVCITGPPGTGKSIALVLMGLSWLLQGHDVHVVSVFYKSFAASQLVRHQLIKSLEAALQRQQHSVSPGRVHFHQYDFFWEGHAHITQAVDDLSSTPSRTGQLHILMDEAWFGYQGLGPCYQKFVDQLTSRVGGKLHLWAADMGTIDIPQQLDQATFTVPLRYCAVVLREVEEGISHYSTVPDYTASGLPVSSDGPNVIHLHHYGNHHVGRWPVQCFQCGWDVANVLLRRLCVGYQGPFPPDSPAPLQFRDVFVLTRSSELQDDVMDAGGRLTSRACNFVHGLRQAGVPVCVLNGTFDNEQQWEHDLADVSVGCSNRVTVSTLGAVNGLERKVVVWLPGRKEHGDDHYTDQAIEALDRLASVSRCSTQLVIVHVLAGPNEFKPGKGHKSTRHTQCAVS